LPDRISSLLIAAVFAGSFLLLMMAALWLLSRRPSERCSTAGASPLARQPDEGQATVTDKSSGGARSAQGERAEREDGPEEEPWWRFLLQEERR
jgi:hypothetical protein